jgi:serine/threonine protein kinase
MVRCVATSGCGCVAVVSLDRGEQGGLNGAGYMVWLWILWLCEGVIRQAEGYDTRADIWSLGITLYEVRGCSNSGSGWVAVVSLDRGRQGGSNGTSYIAYTWILRWIGG